MTFVNTVFYCSNSSAAIAVSSRTLFRKVLKWLSAFTLRVWALAADNSNIKSLYIVYYYSRWGRNHKFAVTFFVLYKVSNCTFDPGLIWENTLLGFFLVQRPFWHSRTFKKWLDTWAASKSAYFCLKKCRPGQVHLKITTWKCIFSAHFFFSAGSKTKQSSGNWVGNKHFCFQL